MNKRDHFIMLGAFVVWAALAMFMVSILAEPVEGFFTGIVDRIDHVIEYERD